MAWTSDWPRSDLSSPSCESRKAEAYGNDNLLSARDLRRIRNHARHARARRACRAARIRTRMGVHGRTPGCWPARGLAAKLSSAGRSVVVHVSAKMFGEPFRGRLTRLVEVGSRAPRVNGVVVAVDFEQTLGLPGSLVRGADHLG